MSRCQSREGFLFKHACGEASGNQCVTCRKAICRDHGRHHPDGHICVSCLRNQGPQRDRADAREHDDDHYHSHSDPYFYSTAYYVGHRSGSYHDRDDFTEGDGAAVLQDGDEGFEHDLEAS